MTGERGDECFAGHQTYRNLVFLEKLNKRLDGNRESFARLLGKANRVAGSEALERYLPLLNIPLEKYYFSRACHPGAPSNLIYDKAYSADFRSSHGGTSPSGPFRRHLEAAPA